jgi:HEAT repeat protein
MLLPYVVNRSGDPFWRVRMWAANTLGRIGDDSTIPLLESLLNDRPEVAKVAQRAISNLQQKDTVPKGG